MDSAKLSKNELTDLIFYGCSQNSIDVSLITQFEINSILEDYMMFCNHFQMAYVKGELDTFKRAACLLVAINRGRLSRDKRTNASIALDAAYKMCEKPYWHVGENYDIPKKLEEVDFKKIFENDMEIFTTSKNMLIDSLVYENGVPLNYNLNLELLYQVALQIKNRSKLESTIDDDVTEEVYENLSQSSNKKLGIKFLSLFKK